MIGASVAADADDAATSPSLHRAGRMRITPPGRPQVNYGIRARRAVHPPGSAGAELAPQGAPWPLKGERAPGQKPDAERIRQPLFSRQRIENDHFPFEHSTALPPGMKPWTAAEKAALLAECAAVDAATAHSQAPKTGARAKADNFGWDDIVARSLRLRRAGTAPPPRMASGRERRLEAATERRCLSRARAPAPTKVDRAVEPASWPVKPCGKSTGT